MPTETNRETDNRILVEHFRSTGYEGREPWVSELDPVKGTRAVAVRQLEACATHPACAWRDEVDDEAGLWGFMRECLLEPLLSLAQILEGTSLGGASCGHQDANAEALIGRAWKTVSKFLDHLQHADPSKVSYPDTAFCFLVGVMVLRQMIDLDARRLTDIANARFVPHSTNVHRTFLPPLVNKLGRNPLNLSGDVTLSELCEKLGALAECRNSSSVAL